MYQLRLISLQLCHKLNHNLILANIEAILQKYLEDINCVNPTKWLAFVLVKNFINNPYFASVFVYYKKILAMSYSSVIKTLFRLLNYLGFQCKNLYNSKHFKINIARTLFICYISNLFRQSFHGQWPFEIFVIACCLEVIRFVRPCFKTA